MGTIIDQITDIEKEIRETPYHKGTEHHIGMLRARLSRLKDKMVESEVKSKGGGGAGGYAVKQQGDATIILVGPPSAGKSTLINKLTNAQSKVAPYAFTTVTVIPGMMVYNNARIQILDVPGLIEGAEEGKGRGREVLSVARACDLIVFITDVQRPEAIERIKAALERNGIRIDKSAPKVHVEKKSGGGLLVHSNIRQEINRETIKDIAREFGIKNGEITIKERLTIEELIDAFSQNRVYIPSISVMNKIDLGKGANLIHPSGGLGWHPALYDNNVPNNSIKISAEDGIGIDQLLDTIWHKLNFVRIYLVKPDVDPNFEDPIVVQTGYTLSKVMELLGSDFSENKTKAKIWGNGSKFPGQEVSLTTHVLEGMQVRFI